MKKLFIILFALFSFQLYSQDIGGDYYVATDGNDGAAGTYAAPWATWDKAAEVATAGDTVYIRGGTYTVGTGLGSGMVIDNSGSVNNYICFFNYTGETPILDCKNQCDGYTGYSSGIYITRQEYIHFKGLTIRNQWMCGFGKLNGAIYGYECANLIFENITVYNIGQKAFWIDGGAWNYLDSAKAVDLYGVDPEDASPPYEYDSTFFINCDVYDVCDSLVSEPGNGGDAWKTVCYQGNYYFWEGCRAWNYTDDGFDPGGNGYRIFENCWTMSSNKYNPYCVSEGRYIEGNGFKIPSMLSTTFDDALMDDPNDTIFVKITNCVAVYNRHTGFYNNLYSGDSYPTFFNTNALIYNNTSYINGEGFADAAHYNSDTCTSVYRNNIEYGSTYKDATSRPLVIETFDYYTESHNTWDYANLGSIPRWDETDTVTVTTADFIETDSTNIVTEFSAARQSDGSLPETWPLSLATGSDLINAGVDVGLSYYGLAPDIGAAEYSGAETDILTFILVEQTTSATINDVTHTVAITVANGTDVTALEPTITLSSGATVNPLSGTATNFTNPVSYTVTAADNITEQSWAVTVTVASAPGSAETDITAFSFTEQIAAASISAVSHTVTVTVAYGTDETGITPTISVSAGATIAPTSGISNDFSSPTPYTVTAENETDDQEWTITVTVQATTIPDYVNYEPALVTGGHDFYDAIDSINVSFSRIYENMDALATQVAILNEGVILDYSEGTQLVITAGTDRGSVVISKFNSNSAENYDNISAIAIAVTALYEDDIPNYTEQTAEEYEANTTTPDAFRSIANNNFTELIDNIHAIRLIVEEL